MRSPSQQSRPILQPKSFRRTSTLHRPTTVEITVEPCSYDSQVVRNTDSEYPLCDASTPPSIRHYIENLPYSDPPLIEPMTDKKEAPLSPGKRRVDTILPQSSSDYTSSSSGSSYFTLSRQKRAKIGGGKVDDGAYIGQYAIPSPSYPASQAEDTDMEEDCNRDVLSELQRLPDLVREYEMLPTQVKNYVLFQLMKRSGVNTLQFINSMIVPVLKRDFLVSLPLEIAIHIISFLDIRSLCRATRVSRRWKNIIDTNGATWQHLLDVHGFKYQKLPLTSSDASYDRSPAYTFMSSFLHNSDMEVDDLEPLKPPHPYKDIFRREYVLRLNWRRGRVQQMEFQAHPPGHVVTCLQFDDDKIVSGADDHAINVFDTKNGQLKRQLHGHEGGVWALQYVDNILVSGATDRTVRVWDIESGANTHVFNGHTSTVRCLQIVMPTEVNGRMEPSVPLIVTGSRDSTLRIWRLPVPGRDEPFDGVGVNPYFMHTLTGHSGSVRSLAAHGNTLVSGSYDFTVCIWDIEQGRLIHRMEGHTAKVYSVVIDHERNQCMSGSMDSTVRIWDIATGQCLRVLEGHSILVGLLGLSPNHLVSAAADFTLRVWNPETGECQQTLRGHRGAITCFQHDDEKIISGSDGGLKMWDIKTGEEIRDLIYNVTGVWRVGFDRRRVVAAVHTDRVTSIRVLDYGVYGLEDTRH